MINTGVVLLFAWLLSLRPLIFITDMPMTSVMFIRQLLRPTQYRLYWVDLDRKIVLVHCKNWFTCKRLWRWSELKCSPDSSQDRSSRYGTLKLRNSQFYKALFQQCKCLIPLPSHMKRKFSKATSSYMKDDAFWKIFPG